MSTMSDVPAGSDAAGPAARPPAPVPAVRWYARQSGRVAVLDAAGAHDYRWLADAAARVAGTLTERYPQHREHIGVVRRPDAVFVAAVLGCLQAGLTVSVLDRDGPVAAELLGVSAMLADLDALVSGDPLAAPGPDHAPAPGDDWTAGSFDLRAEDRFAVLSGSPGHWLSAMSSAMCAGAALLATAPELTGGPGAAGWLRDNGATVVFTTVPVARSIAAHAPDGHLAGLRYAFVDNAGALLAHDVQALRRVAPAARCVGTYRTGSTGRPAAMYPVPDGWDAQDAPLRLPLGAATDELRLLAAGDRDATFGEIGEVCLGAYRTGDLARRWPDGILEFAGLAGMDPGADPAETTAALLDLPQVREAVVAELIDDDGEPVLAGYVAGEPAMDAAAVRRAVSLRLPDHLVPAVVHTLDALPLTPAGDYDWHALPGDTAGAAAEYVAARTPLETELAGILQQLLGAERVGVFDTFFELGGFSLLATQLATRVRESFGVEVSLRDIFEAPTVDGLAQLIVRRQVEGAEDLEALLDEIERSAGSGEPDPF